MIGHTFSKIYATNLNTILSSDLNRRNCKAKGQAGFKEDYQTMEHILTLWDIIEEAQHHSKKFYNCFVCFHFDSIPRATLFERLRDIDIFEILLTTIMWFNEMVVGRLRAIEGLSDPI